MPLEQGESALTFFGDAFGARREPQRARKWDALVASQLSQGAHVAQRCTVLGETRNTDEAATVGLTSQLQ